MLRENRNIRRYGPVNAYEKECQSDGVQDQKYDELIDKNNPNEDSLQKEEQTSLPNIAEIDQDDQFIYEDNTNLPNMFAHQTGIKMAQLINNDNINEASLKLRDIMEYNHDDIMDIVFCILQDPCLQVSLVDYKRRHSCYEIQCEDDVFPKELSIIPSEEDYTPESMATRERVDSILRGYHLEELDGSDQSNDDVKKIEDKLKPLYDSHEAMVAFVKGMRDLLVHHRSMLKAKYLFNPENKEETLQGADYILDICLRFVQEFSPEFVIEKLDTEFSCYEGDSSSLIYMRDPESALATLFSRINRVKNILFGDLFENNTTYTRDDYYYSNRLTKKFWKINEIKDGIKEAWTELADSLDENIGIVELRAIIARALLINHYCNSNYSYNGDGKDSIIAIFQKCKENSRIFNFSFRDLLNDTYVKDARPYYRWQGDKFEKLVDFVQHCSGKKIAIFTHFRPDCDAYGSQIALGLLMEMYGAKVSLFNISAKKDDMNHNETLEILGLKDHNGNDLVKISSDFSEESQFDEIIILDSNQKRAGVPDSISSVLVLDHHEDANFVEALASCEFVGYLYERLIQDENFKNIIHFESSILLDHSLDVESLIPFLLYTGCYTDTSSFIRGSSNFNRLIKRFEQNNKFLSADTISNMVEYASPSRYRQKFADYLLEHNRVVKLKNGLGMIVFDEVDSLYFPLMNKKNLFCEDVSLSSDYVRIFPPQDRNAYSLSFRSTDDSYGASRIARVFGGGGHQNAAACSIGVRAFTSSYLISKFVKEITGWSDREYHYSELAHNLRLLKSANNYNNFRNTLIYIALSRGDYVEALKLSCPEFHLLDVGGIYINYYITSLSLILEAIPNVNCVNDCVDDFCS